MQWNIKIFVSLFQSNFLSNRVTYEKRKSYTFATCQTKKIKKLHDFINFCPLNKVAVCFFITNLGLFMFSAAFFIPAVAGLLSHRLARAEDCTPRGRFSQGHSHGQRGPPRFRITAQGMHCRRELAGRHYRFAVLA